jgi:hypothetical protein
LCNDSLMAGKAFINGARELQACIFLHSSMYLY